MGFLSKRMQAWLDPKPNYDQALVETLMTASLDAFIVIDEDSIILEWNVAAERVFGYARHEVVGRDLVNFIIPVGLRNKHRVGMKRFIRTNTSEILNRRVELSGVNKEGEEFPIEITIIPIHTNKGFIFTAAIRNLTAVKKAEETQDLINREYRHRLKNIMATIIALANKTLHSEDTPSFLARLFALSKVQDLLFERGWTNALLGDIVETGIYAYDRGDAFRIKGTPYEVSSNAAMSFSLVIHELCTNAVKYGALSVERGYVQITWAEIDGALVWVWQEFNGPPVVEPKEKSFGYRLINRAFTGEGETIVEFLPGGLKCKFVLKFEGKPQDVII